MSEWTFHTKFLECSFQVNLVFGFQVMLNKINVNQVIDHALPYTAVNQFIYYAVTGIDS